MPSRLGIFRSPIISVVYCSLLSTLLLFIFFRLKTFLLYRTINCGLPPALYLYMYGILLNNLFSLTIWREKRVKGGKRGMTKAEERGTV